MDMARLGMQVDSSEVRTATTDTDRLAAATASAATEAGGLKAKVADMGRSARNIGAGMSLALTTPITAFLTSSLTSFKVQEDALAKVTQAVDATGGAAGRSAEQLGKMASELQAASLFGDETILDKVTAQLLTFTGITGESFDRAQLAALDLATTLNGDLQGATIQLAKALENPVQGLSVLSRSGITFTESQKDMIKGLVEAGDLMGAQSLILDEVAAKYGGQAAAAAGTFGGQMTQLANAFDDWKEVVGEALAEILPPFVNFMQNAVAWLGELEPETVKWGVSIGLVAAAAGPLVATLGLLAMSITAIGLPVLAAAAGIAALTAAAVAFWPEINAVRDAMTAWRLDMQDKVVGALSAMQDGLASAATAVIKFGTDALDWIKAKPAEIAEAFAALPGQMLAIGRDAIKGLWDGIAGAAGSIRSKAAEVGSGLLSSLRGTLRSQSPSLAMRDIGVDAMRGLEIGMASREGAVEDQAAALATSMTETLATGFGDFFARGLQDFDGFVSSVRDGFKRLIADLVSMAARNRIMIGLGMGGVGGAAPALAAGGPGAAAGGPLGAIGRAFLGGAGSVAGGMMSGGLGGGLGAIETALGGATTGLAGLATAAGAIALPVAAAVAAFTFFRSKTKELDNGLRVTARGVGALVEEFKKTETSRFWGFSKKRNTDYDRADQEVRNPIRKAYADMVDSVRGMGGSLRLGSKWVRDFSHSFELSLKGMTDEQAMVAVQRELGLLSDAMARQAMGTGKYIRDTETATQALQRMSTALRVANTAFKSLGWQLYDTSLKGGEFASRFVDRMGGLEKFAEGTQFYFDNFYSLSERAAEAQRQFTRAFKDLPSSLAGAVPKTEAHFRRILERMVEAGHGASAAALLGMAPLFVEMLNLKKELKGLEVASDEAGRSVGRAGKGLEVLRERAGLERRILELQGRTGALRKLDLAALDKSNRGLLRNIWALEKQASAAERAAKRAEEIAARDKRRADEAKQAARSVAEEGAGLERRILELQGDTATLRKLELRALDPVNRALQRMIWGLEDARAAIDALDPQDFASKFDFDRARGLAASGTGGARTGTAPIYLPPATATAEQSNVVELRHVRRELAAMRDENRQLGMQISAYTRGARDTLRRFDRDGMPAVRPDGA